MLTHATKSLIHFILRLHDDLQSMTSLSLMFFNGYLSCRLGLTLDGSFLTLSHLHQLPVDARLRGRELLDATVGGSWRVRATALTDRVLDVLLGQTSGAGRLERLVVLRSHGFEFVWVALVADGVEDCLSVDGLALGRSQLSAWRPR